MKKGDIVYVNDNRYGLSKAQITKCIGNYYTIKLLDHQCGYGVPAHRLISEADYIAMHGNQDPLHPANSPYLH